MAHRRKSSHPVCKTRRNLEMTVADVNAADEDCDIIDQALTRSHGNVREALDTDEEDPQQIVLPSDLYKDFEAVRTQTKLDTTNLMRRLLKDYQSIAVGNDKTMQVSPNEEHVDNDVTDSLTTKTSIANDVSLATARVDTEDDQYQGLDLSVGPRRISSQLFDTKSLNCESLEQPLDLTCSKQPTSKDSLNNDSSSVQQLDMSGVHNEFNYVYVYPGLYPPGTGVMTTDDMETDVQPETSSPVPELLSPGKLPSPDTLERTAYVIPNEVCESNFAATPSRFNDYTKETRQHQQSSDIPHLAKVSPQSIKQEFSEMQFGTSGQQSHGGQKSGHGGSPNKSGKKENKRSTEMKVISENTTAGVYTSVMKLPWSRRTRTKKPKHKVKLEDTLIPQFMLEQGNEGNEFQDWNASHPSPSGETSDLNNSISKRPVCSESVMMVYPSGGTSAYGKPVRKRGRPPKLPMLAKLLQHQQAGKKVKQEKHEEEMQAQITQQVQANGGMVVYNSGGQIMTAYGGIPSQPTTSTSGELQNVQPSTTIPNMAQAQLIGQIPLSQLTGGPIQFLGQFPAQALPFPGHMLQTIPTSTSDPSQLQPSLNEIQDQNGDKDVESSMTPKADIPPSINYQYAFQPMFIPAGAMPFPMFPNAPIPATSESEGDVKDISVTVTTSNSPSDTKTSSLPVSINTSPTHVMKCDETNTVSTMSTTSISNTGSGAIYQEMILSSKSLVDVKKRRRQTAIQMLKSKSGDQNFLCTSFRIRPRLVAQAQAQRERMAAKGVKEEINDDESEYTDSKNLISPQNDTDHFGENKRECGVDFASIQIKQEVDADDELYQNMNAYEAKRGVVEKNDRRKRTVKPLKRYMLKGSQKRKAKFYGSRIVNDNADMVAGSDRGSCAKQLEGKDDSSDLFQELFNCKVCNKIISVDDMEAHSLEHSCKNYQCPKCDSAYNEGQVGAEEPPKCLNCGESLIRIDERDYNDGNIECDECPETFKSLPEFYEHKTGHKNDQTSQGGFECDFCGKIYQYYHALQFHRRTHRERKVPCLDKLCDIKFRSRKEMEVHFDSKHPEKKEYFHCVYEGCTKKFLKNFHLQEHIRVKHYNIKAFQCPWPGCLKEFAARGHLKIHLLIHRDEKPMKCDHCEYRCRQRSAMNWHMRKHPDVPYKYKRAVKSPSASKSESE